MTGHSKGASLNTSDDSPPTPNNPPNDTSLKMISALWDHFQPYMLGYLSPVTGALKREGGLWKRRSNEPPAQATFPPPMQTLSHGDELCSVPVLCARSAKSRRFWTHFPWWPRLTAVTTVFPCTGLLKIPP